MHLADILGQGIVELSKKFSIIFYFMDFSERWEIVLTRVMFQQFYIE